MVTLRLAFWPVLLLASGVFADDISLVRVGDTWRYCRGTNEPSSPIEAWRSPGFDDTAWPQVLSAFSTLPYEGDGTREATFLAPSSSCLAYYFRRAFTVTNAAAIKWLSLRLDYTHGFVAYLNGQEILRRGLTNNPATYDCYADYHVGGTAEEFDVSPFVGLLTNGQNLLAIQAHTAVTNPPGYAYAMRVVPELLGNFQRGPFVENASTHSIQVIWRTPLPADSVVEFGADASLGGQVADVSPVTNHVLTLANLLPGTRYYYRVKSTAGGVTAVSPVASFRTLKSEGDFSFLVLGDSGSASSAQYKLAALMAQANPDLVMHCGDIVYNHFLLGREDYRCLSIYGPQMRSVPFFFCAGNEDLETPAVDQPFLSTFYLPTNSVTGTKHFYSLDHGNAHFAVLWVPSLKHYPGTEPYWLTNGSPQYNWLTNDLATTTKPWKFIVMHSPVAGSSYHRFDDDNANGIYDTFELHDLLVPVAQRYGVQIIFSGHEHDYERSNPMGGVYQIVSGGGGGPLPTYYITERDAADSEFYLSWHFVQVTVQGDTLRLQAIGTNGVAFDSMTVQRKLPPPQLYDAAWHSPLVESSPANDGHGNINGQTFGFAGTPILTLAGAYANLGRVFVNNDATNLYIGFEQVMIYSNNNVFLFIESPRQTGVTNLIGLGDGLTGTTQGVDGLDFLENLSFTNFAPSVACLLGDEYADGQDRFFQRPGLDLEVGQGVFRLDAGFSDVPGVRLQQFNRSPQILEPAPQLRFPEQNANFIEIAIPFDQLGGLRPGDIIQIAAVVGGPQYDTNLQARALDTGFLGSSLTGSGLSNATLGAVSVRLALDPNGDEDGDGLPNGWELQYGLDPFSSLGDNGSAGDPDHDGMSNWEEFIAGTNPRDPNFTLRLSLLPLDPTHNLLTWPAVVGKRYQLEISSGTQAFADYPDGLFPLTATLTNEMFEDALPTNPQPPIRLYRLRVIP